ncbi:cohesin loading factor [Colletotrichum graminicola]|uniref:Cohesin loading factor n=1 Tax=Colletotrichum graminicola (strain M1.001 / M2 / FGSC 10212) TaxID=645133 RepID=E3QAN9_COLGM|nr:cohesin loading factor [Colletotrichum graminicola M1.001]EFQ27927.1 cohesin loading factor [Colletotrichum graminicola M1.001]WDK12148.1 cohesin loading factor [Colletotrichum graminicola]
MTYRGSLPSGQAFNGQQQAPQPYNNPYGSGNGNGSGNSQNPTYANAAYGGHEQAQPVHGDYHHSPAPAPAPILPAPTSMNMQANGYGQFPAYGSTFPQQQQLPHPQQQQLPHPQQQQLPHLQQQQQPQPRPHYPHHHQTQQPFAHNSAVNGQFAPPHSFTQNTHVSRSPALAPAPTPFPTPPVYAEYQPTTQSQHQPQFQPQYQQLPLPPPQPPAQPQQQQHQPQPQHKPHQQQQRSPQVFPAVPQYAQFSQPTMGQTQGIPVLNQTFTEPPQVQPSPEPNFANSPTVQPARSPSIARKSPAISSMNSPAISSRGSPALSSKAKSYDTTTILVHVAEECFEKARRGVQRVAVSGSDNQVREYQKLITTGLACLEAAFQSNRLSPRQEAKARLRYASILCDETENLQEAETALSKGITICDKHRYTDLKYCMQYLLLKVLFQRNQKAAFIAVDKNISDCLTFKHIHWVYAFRLLKATLHVHAGSPPDAAVLDNLRAIAALAGERGDHAMVVFASLMEGLSVLRTMRTDTIERVQTCLAQATKYQLDPSVQIPQLDVLTLLLDLACSMHQKTPDILIHKLRSLQAKLDANLGSQTWTDLNPEILIPIKKHNATSATLSDDTSAILRAGSSNGQHDYIVMTFLNRLEIVVLTYTFSGLAGMYRPGSDPKRSHEFWKEGFDVLAKWNKEVAPSVPAASLREAMEQAKWRTEMFCYLQTLTGLYFATHSQWSKVEQCVAQLQQAITPAVNEIFSVFSLYLSGVYHQGTGDLETALILFEDERLSIHAGRGGPGGRKPAKLELCILAALNRIWILQDSSYRDELTSTDLLEQLRPMCTDHQDPDIRTAFNLVQATANTLPPPSMHQIKTSITNSLNGSKVTGNTHCLAIALSIMRFRLFDNVVGEQALKSARAASTQAKRSGNLLWMSVADGMLADSFEVQALFADADAARQTATDYASHAFTGKE